MPLNPTTISDDERLLLIAIGWTLSNVMAVSNFTEGACKEISSLTERVQSAAGISTQDLDNAVGRKQR